jgi:miniconductance mechanosensitive channel
VPYENLQSEVFEHLFAVLPQFGLRVFQAPAGTDFSSVPVQPSMVEMPKRKSVRKKKQLPDNSNTLF